MKQVIIVRKDLKMDCGKIAGQVAHASVRAYKESEQYDRLKWFIEGETKIILKVKSQEELENIMDRCKELKIPYSPVKDAGRTQIPPGTLTSIGIGPLKSETVDQITKGLKLL